MTEASTAARRASMTSIVTSSRLFTTHEITMRPQRRYDMRVFVAAHNCVEPRTTDDERDPSATVPHRVKHLREIEPTAPIRLIDDASRPSVLASPPSPTQALNEASTKHSSSDSSLILTRDDDNSAGNTSSATAIEQLVSDTDADDDDARNEMKEAVKSKFPATYRALRYTSRIGDALATLGACLDVLDGRIPVPFTNETNHTTEDHNEDPPANSCDDEEEEVTGASSSAYDNNGDDSICSSFYSEQIQLHRLTPVMSMKPLETDRPHFIVKDEHVSPSYDVANYEKVDESDATKEVNDNDDVAFMQSPFPSGVGQLVVDSDALTVGDGSSKLLLNLRKENLILPIKSSMIDAADEKENVEETSVNDPYAADYEIPDGFTDNSSDVSDVSYMTDLNDYNDIGRTPKPSGVLPFEMLMRRDRAVPSDTGSPSLLLNFFRLSGFKSLMEEDKMAVDGKVEADAVFIGDVRSIRKVKHEEEEDEEEFFDAKESESHSIMPNRNMIDAKTAGRAEKVKKVCELKQVKEVQKELEKENICEIENVCEIEKICEIENVCRIEKICEIEKVEKSCERVIVEELKRACQEEKVDMIERICEVDKIDEVEQVICSDANIEAITQLFRRRFASSSDGTSTSSSSEQESTKSRKQTRRYLELYQKKFDSMAAGGDCWIGGESTTATTITDTSVSKESQRVVNKSPFTTDSIVHLYLNQTPKEIADVGEAEVERMDIAWKMNDPDLVPITVDLVQLSFQKIYFRVTYAIVKWLATKFVAYRILSFLIKKLLMG